MAEGIFGIFYFDQENKVDRKQLLQMATFIQFKSDEIALINKGPIGIGLKRVPRIREFQVSEIRCNETNDIWAAFLGEIYNYSDIRRILEQKHDFRTLSDVELVTHLYEEYGNGFAKMINGQFVIALWDEREQKFMLIRDRFGGIRSLYYLVNNDSLIFASQIKFILNISKIEKRIDTNALELFLKYSYIPSPHTIFNGVKKLIPGHFLLCQSGRIRCEKYWDFTTPEVKIEDEEFASKEYLSLLEKAIQIRLRSDTDVGILLSGGLDSSSIVALTSKLSEKQLNTFSIGFQNSHLSELKYARIVSEVFNTKHHELTMDSGFIKYFPLLIRYLEEPYTEAGALLTLAALKLAKEKVEVVLGGEGADQLFGVEGQCLAIRSILERAFSLRLVKKICHYFDDWPLFRKDNILYLSLIHISEPTRPY